MSLVMTRTSYPRRHPMQSSPAFLGEASSCGPNSMSASPSEDSNHHLDPSIKQAIRRWVGKQVRGFVVMALHGDGDISKHTTDHDPQSTNNVFLSDAGDSLRVAHMRSILEARIGQGYLDRDLIFQSNFGDISSQKALFDSEHNRMVGSQPAKSLYDLSRPISALSYGVPNGWQSDFDEVKPAHGSMSMRSQSGGTSPHHFGSLMICESAKVEDFLIRKFRTMQQSAVKRIAKAWIKGICPKKQATFPYHKKKREREGLNHPTGCIPDWWPVTSVCRFVEPDHIKRHERISLCIHLLRLRPTPSKLKEWNKGCVEPHRNHMMKGWIEFLKELAPPGIFDVMREPEGKTQQEHQKSLAQIYHLSKKEEEYENGAIGA